MHSSNLENFKPMLAQSEKVNDITKVLTEQTGVTHFGFIEIYSDGSFIELENNAKNFSLLLDSDVPKDCSLDILNTRKEFGIYLSDASSKNFFHSEVKRFIDYFNEDHFMQILEKTQEKGQTVVRYYTYGTQKGNKKINRAYVNQLDLFHQFNKYFRWRMQETIENFEPIKVTNDVSTAFKKTLEDKVKVDAKKSMLKVLPELMYTKANAGVTLRQREVLTYYMQGMTSQEIATELNLSYRTIERHLDNIRSKYKCSSRRQLLSKLIADGFTFNE